jgi:hypothetical protein
MVFSAVTINSTIFTDVIPCSLEEVTDISRNILPSSSGPKSKLSNQKEADHLLLAGEGP